MAFSLASSAEYGADGQVVSSNGTAVLGQSPHSVTCLGSQKYEQIPEAIQNAILRYAAEGPLADNEDGLRIFHLPSLEQ